MYKRRIYKLYEDVVKYIEQRREYSDEELIETRRQTAESIKDYRNTCEKLTHPKRNLIASIITFIVLIILAILKAVIFKDIALITYGIDLSILICIGIYSAVTVGVRILDISMINRLKIEKESLKAVCKSTQRI